MSWSAYPSSPSRSPWPRGRVEPNAFYGVRFAESFRSDDAWYAINRFGGRRLIAWAVPLAILGVACFPLRLQHHLWLTCALAPLPLLFVLAPTWQAWRFARRYRPGP